MDQSKVFVSSILNRQIDDLCPEREAVREVVESYRFLKLWAFEREPASTEDLDQSYLRQVDECDLFILIVGKEVTNPVMAECLRAKEKDKPILLFVKSLPERTALAQSLIQLSGVKYARFGSLEELRCAVRDAIDNAVVDGLQMLPSGPRSKSVFNQLRKLADGKVIVRLTPVIPRSAEQKDYNMEKVEVEMLRVSRLGSGQCINIPTNRVLEVLYTGTTNPPTVVLKGRLQWVSPGNRWLFLPDSVPADSELGFAKTVGTEDPYVRSLIGRLEASHWACRWFREDHFSSKISEGWQLVYDEDGRYLKVIAPSTDLYLLCKPLPGAM